MLYSRDGHQFENFATSLRPALVSQARRLTGNRGTADDLVQDVMIAAWNAWARWSATSDDVNASAKAWMLTIMSNKFMDLTRTPHYRDMLSTDQIASHRIHRIFSTDSQGGNISEVGDGVQVADKIARAMYFSRFGVDDDTWTPCHSSTNHGPSVRDDFGEFVDAAVSRLNRHQQDVMRLYFMEELTMSEVGERLGIPRATASTRLMRGLNKIRPMLTRYASDAGFRTA